MEMTVGDLVTLNPIHFIHHDECIGIIIDEVEDGLFKVAWMDESNGELFGWFNEDELEVL